ncbi:MAG: AsmA family protein [Candidatus Eiseniibacteriota bacterium]|nr:MAG: AsmA family protein [Candidatus Eisenbacteria bacterium]
MKARLLKRVVIAVVSVLVVVTVLFFVLRAVFPSEVLRELAVAKLETATGLDISVKNAAISFVHWRIGVSVSGVEVYQPAGGADSRLATIPQVGAVVALGPLLRREVVVEQLYIERPEVDVKVAGVWAPVVDTPEAALASAPGTGRVRLPVLFSFSLPKAVVRNGNVRLEDTLSGGVLLLSRLNATARVKAKRGGEVLRSEGTFSSKDLRILAGREASFALPAQQVDGSWRMRVLPSEKLLELEEVSVKVSGLPVQISGTVDLAEGRPNLGLKFGLEGKLDKFTRFVPAELLQKVQGLELKGDVVVSGSVDGRLPSPDYDGTFGVVDGGGSVSGVKIRKVGVSGRFNKEAVNVEQFEVSLGSSTVRGSATATTQEPRRLTFESTGNAMLEELAALLPEQEGPKVRGGELSFKVKGGGLAEELKSDPLSAQVHGEASVKAVEIELPAPNPRVTLESGHLTFSGRRADIADLSAKVGGSVFNVAVAIDDWKERSAKLRIESPSIDLEELLRPLAEARLARPGEKGVSGLPPVPVAGLPVRGTATLDVKKLTHGYFRGENLRARLQFGPDSLVVDNLSMQTLGGKCSGEGRILLAGEGTPSYRGSFSADEIEIAELLLSFTPVKEFLKGRTFLQLSVQGNLGEEVNPINSILATGQVRTTGASAIASPIVAAVVGLTGLEQKGEYPLKDFATSFLVEDGKLVVPRCQLVEKHSTWEFSGSTGFDGTLNHRVNVTLSKERSDRLGSLKGLDRLLKDNEGRVVLDFLVGGTVKKPSLDWDRRRMEERAREFLAQKLRQELERGKEKGEELKEELKGDLEQEVEKLKKETAEKGKKLLEELFKKKKKE